MSQALTTTIMILIGLMMLASTLLYNYTIVAEHLDDEKGWKFWSRMRVQMERKWDRGRDSLALVFRGGTRRNT